MRVKICVARSSDGQVRAYIGENEEKSREYAVMFLIEDGYEIETVYWVEAELPEPQQPSVIAVTEASHAE